MRSIVVDGALRDVDARRTGLTVDDLALAALSTMRAERTVSGSVRTEIGQTYDPGWTWVRVSGVLA